MLTNVFVLQIFLLYIATTLKHQSFIETKVAKTMKTLSTACVILAALVTTQGKDLISE